MIGGLGNHRASFAAPERRRISVSVFGDIHDLAVSLMQPRIIIGVVPHQKTLERWHRKCQSKRFLEMQFLSLKLLAVGSRGTRIVGMRVLGPNGTDVDFGNV